MGQSFYSSLKKILTWYSKFNQAREKTSSICGLRYETKKMSRNWGEFENVEEKQCCYSNTTEIFFFASSLFLLSMPSQAYLKKKSKQSQANSVMLWRKIHTKNFIVLKKESIPVFVIPNFWAGKRGEKKNQVTYIEITLER